jgi:hypothetical protein
VQLLIICFHEIKIIFLSLLNRWNRGCFYLVSKNEIKIIFVISNHAHGTNLPSPRCIVACHLPRHDKTTTQGNVFTLYLIDIWSSARSIQIFTITNNWWQLRGWSYEMKLACLGTLTSHITDHVGISGPYHVSSTTLEPTPASINYPWRTTYSLARFWQYSLGTPSPPRIWATTSSPSWSTSLRIFRKFETFNLTRTALHLVASLCALWVSTFDVEHNHFTRRVNVDSPIGRYRHGVYQGNPWHSCRVCGSVQSDIPEVTWNATFSKDTLGNSCWIQHFITNYS